MITLTRQDILAHQAVVPWPEPYQVEQDLLLSLAMHAIFNDTFLQGQVAMRGGTVLHKVHLAPAARYSDDIDLVAVGERPEGHIRKALVALRLQGAAGDPVIAALRELEVSYRDEWCWLYDWASAPVGQAWKNTSISKAVTSRGRCRRPRNVACQLSIARSPWRHDSPVKTAISKSFQRKYMV